MKGLVETYSKYSMNKFRTAASLLTEIDAPSAAEDALPDPWRRTEEERSSADMFDDRNGSSMCWKRHRFQSFHAECAEGGDIASNRMNRRMMPIPVKPCVGRFSDELQVLLTRNHNREQWALHPCQLCGTAVGAVQVHGTWVPEQHWPSVTYPPRNAVAKKHDRSAARQEDEAPAESMAH